MLMFDRYRSHMVLGDPFYAHFLCHLLRHMIWHSRIPITVIFIAGMVVLVALDRNADERMLLLANSSKMS